MTAAGKDWRERVLDELSRADAARDAGNEGMARVCARRAAGWTARAYLLDAEIPNIKNSAFGNLVQLKELELIRAKSGLLIEHLTSSLEKDDPNGESYWPADIDLIAEARQLIKELYSDFSEII